MEEIKKWNLIVSNLLKDIEVKKYYYQGTGSFINDTLQVFTGNMKMNEHMYVYWHELIMRMHYSSVTCLMRNSKWLSGIVNSIENNNYILFAASMRGFFESMVDTTYSIATKGSEVAMNFMNINLSLTKQMSKNFMAGKFEEDLIHFGYASKESFKKDKDPNHKPKLMRDYISDFDLPGSEMRHEFYSELCEITHPAANSVNCFSKEIIIDSRKSYLITDDTRDNELIREFCNKYNVLIEILLKLSVSIPVINLKVINLLECEDLYSPSIENSFINKYIEEGPAWKDILVLIGGNEDDGSSH